MREPYLLLLFELLLILLTHGGGHAEVIQVVAPPLRVSPKDSEDLELCYNMKVPEGELRTRDSCSSRRIGSRDRFIKICPLDVIKIHNTMSSPVHFDNKNIFFYFVKTL
jgi:hypothetical protein